MTDKEILDTVIGGMTIRDMGAMSFLQWLAKKANGLPTYRGETQELLLAVSAPSMSRVMPDDEKIRLVHKLEALNIPIV